MSLLPAIAYPDQNLTTPPALVARNNFPPRFDFEKEFSAYLDANRTSLVRRARRLLNSHEDAEDAVADAILAACKSASFDPTRGTTMDAWMYTIVRHECGDRLAKRARQPRMTSLRSRETMDADKDLAVQGHSPCRRRVSHLQTGTPLPTDPKHTLKRAADAPEGFTTMSGEHEAMDESLAEQSEDTQFRRLIAELILRDGGKDTDVKIFVAISLDRRTPEEIAPLLGLQRDNVRQRLCRTRKRLIAILERVNPAYVARYKAMVDAEKGKARG